jgi:hypothetical protein
MAELHKSWITAAQAAGIIRFEDATVTIKDVPNKGDKHEESFKLARFIASPENLMALWTLADAERGEETLDDGSKVPGENPLNVLLTYAYGLNCRAKVRAQYEAKFEDPEKAIKKIAESLVKAGRFKSYEKALAAARLLQETDE